MPRKGFEKARTGCITCKARKVKCDESWPKCLRCKASGRVCAGYRAPPIGSFSWKSLLLRPSILPSSTSNELRGLDFFRCIIAPALTSPLGNSFWTRPVCQLAIQEPATRYAVLAISSLYERFDPFSYNSLSIEQDVAVGYYNKAMRRVATSRSLDADTGVLISILFTCIGFLRGKTHEAIAHASHGTRILTSMENPSPDIVALINHLSIFPHFFGSAAWELPPLQPPKYPSRAILSLSQAVQTLDCLMSRCVRLLRAFDPFRLGQDKAEIPSPLILTQYELLRELDIWYTEFSVFRENLESNTENDAFLRILEVRWYVCNIWLQIANQDEMFCDAIIFREKFERIVDVAREYAASSGLAPTKSPNFFKFEMELSPLLHFVVLKCRYLELRLAAWNLLRVVGCARESLWDSVIMYAIGRRVIEREHEIEIPPGITEEKLEHTGFNSALPSNDVRIRDSYLEDETELNVDCGGMMMTRMRISFFVLHGGQSQPKRVRDWIYLPVQNQNAT
ncbi:hypothetical protein GGR58DRAFT_464603 [Xylaria digitata]|nr:hypothetical protein GGR58DRAFT_464603 [Xylaria digitata]